MAVHSVLRSVLISGTLTAGLTAGCAAPLGERPSAEDPGAQAHEATGEVGATPRLMVSANEAFYLERTEPEETLRGVLRRAKVQEGPNTREMPLRLVVGEKELPVYVSGFDLATLRQFVDRRVEVVGKRIDLRREGHGVEVWIATIAHGQ